MTIKEFALLAGVSVSTVSKIMNGKDASISALVSDLLYGFSMEASCRIASCAAGFSITRQGVTPALVDKDTLEQYLEQNYPSLIKEADRKKDR